MSLTLYRVEVGIAGVLPGQILMSTSDDLATITQPGYLNSNSTGIDILPTDIIDCVYGDPLVNKQTFTPTFSNGVITLVSIGGGGSINGATNLGAGAGLLGVSGDNITGKSIVAGANITVTPTANDITIAATGSGGGTITGIVDVGTGEGHVAAGTSGANVQVKSIKAGTDIVVTENSNTITIASSASPPSGITGATNLGGGEGVFASTLGSILQFKSFMAGSGISLSSTGTEIEITNTGSGGGFGFTNTLFVATGGNDANSGTDIDSPLLTMAEAFSRINTGSNWLINILDSGTYVCDNLTPVVALGSAQIAVNGPGATLTNSTLNPLFNPGIFGLKVNVGITQSTTATNAISVNSGCTQFYSTTASVGNINVASGGDLYLFCSQLSLSTITSPAGADVRLEVLNGTSVTVTTPGSLTGRIGNTYYPGGGSGGFDWLDTFWVAKNGNDANDGKSIDSPKLTLASAFSEFTTPTTPSVINIADNGSYSALTIPANSNVKIFAPGATLASIDNPASATAIIDFDTITGDVTNAGNLTINVNNVNSNIFSTGILIGNVGIVAGDVGNIGNKINGQLDLTFNRVNGEIYGQDAFVKLIGNFVSSQITVISSSVNGSGLTGFVGSTGAGFQLITAGPTFTLSSFFYGSQTSDSEFLGYGQDLNNQYVKRELSFQDNVPTTNFTITNQSSNTVLLFDETTNGDITLPALSSDPNFDVGFRLWVCQVNSGNARFVSTETIESVSGKRWTEGRGAIVRVELLANDGLNYTWGLSGQLAGSAINSNVIGVDVSNLTGSDTTGIGSETQPYATIGAAKTALGSPASPTPLIVIDGATYDELVLIDNANIRLVSPDAVITNTTGNAITFDTDGTNNFANLGSVVGFGGNSAIVSLGTSATYINANTIVGPVSTDDGDVFIEALTLNSNITTTGTGTVRGIVSQRLGTNTGNVSIISPEGSSSPTFEVNAFTASSLAYPVADGSAGYIMTTDGAGTLTLSAPPSGTPPMVEVAGTTQAVAVNTRYQNNNAALTTFNLPATFAVGDTVEIQGYGAAGWTLVASTGDVIHYFGVDTSAGGSLSSTASTDTVKITGAVADTEWTVNYNGGAGLTTT